MKDHREDPVTQDKQNKFKYEVCEYLGLNPEQITELFIEVGGDETEHARIKFEGVQDISIVALNELLKKTLYS
jgi:hypothetical protein